MNTKPRTAKSIARVAASTVVMTAGLGLAGLGAAAIAQAQPAPFPDYHWCPGEAWDPGWGPNWDYGRCHDDHWYDGENRDAGHWHGYGDPRNDGWNHDHDGWNHDHDGWNHDHDGWNRDHDGWNR